MPFERRDILFYLNDVKEIIQHHTGLFDAYLPKDMEEITLLEVLDIETLKRPRSDRHLAIISNLKADLSSVHGVVFCGQKKGMFNRDKEICFMVPANIMIEAMVIDCKRRNIMIPKEGQKYLFVEDIQVGLRIEKKDSALELEAM